MPIKKKRSARRVVKKGAGRKRVAVKRAPPKRRSLKRRPATARRPSKKRTSKSTNVRRKARKVEEARYQLIEAEKELAVEKRPNLAHPATKKRGADPHVPSGTKRGRHRNAEEQKLEQGLEESMAGSDPVSVTQPATPTAEKPEDVVEASDDDS